MKLTSVEWLVQELGSYLPTSIKEVQSLIEQAKEMEKREQGYNYEKVCEIERFRAIDFAKWFSDFNGLTWEEKRVTKERLDTLYEKYLGTLGGGI